MDHSTTKSMCTSCKITTAHASRATHVFTQSHMAVHALNALHNLPCPPTSLAAPYQAKKEAAAPAEAAVPGLEKRNVFTLFRAWLRREGGESALARIMQQVDTQADGVLDMYEVLALLRKVGGAGSNWVKVVDRVECGVVGTEEMSHMHAPEAPSTSCCATYWSVM